jgi:hypothetical protein
MYLQVQDITQAGQPLSRRPANGQYELAPPIVAATVDRFSSDLEGIRDDRTGVRGLFEIDEITMLACPDLMRAYQAEVMNLDQVHGIMELMISMCEGSASGDIPNPPNRMVLLDPPPEFTKPQQVVEWLNRFNRRSMFAALYYPWIKVANPRDRGNPILVPPCGHIMGVWARTDETRGVYKAPANEVPRGVIGLGYETNFREQELLNPLGINCIRTFPNRGIRIWGARTLVEPDKTEWRYISVRRLISYIEKSIELGTQWVVFEPNDEDLWARVRRTVSNFLERIWRPSNLPNLQRSCGCGLGIGCCKAGNVCTQRCVTLTLGCEPACSSRAEARQGPSLRSFVLQSGTLARLSIQEQPNEYSQFLLPQQH